MRKLVYFLIISLLPTASTWPQSCCLPGPCEGCTEKNLFPSAPSWPPSPHDRGALVQSRRLLGPDPAWGGVGWGGVGWAAVPGGRLADGRSEDVELEWGPLGLYWHGGQWASCPHSQRRCTKRHSVPLLLPDMALACPDDTLVVYKVDSLAFFYHQGS